MFTGAVGTAGTTTAGTVRVGIGAAISSAVALAMAAVSAFAAGVGVASSGAEVASSGAVKVTFVGVREGAISDVAVASFGAGLMRAAGGPAVAVPTFNVAVVAARVMFNVAVEEEAAAVTSNAVAAVAVVTLNRGAAVAGGEPLRPVEEAGGVRTDQPAAIRSARPPIARS
jgi:hypothetical protein